MRQILYFIDEWNRKEGKCMPPSTQARLQSDLQVITREVYYSL